MAFKGLDEVVKELNSVNYKNIDDYVIQVAASMGYSEEDIETILTARKSRRRERELGMSEFKEKVQAATKINIEDLESFDKNNHKIVTNRSGNGITISNKGLITFQKILADELADYFYSMNKNGFLEVLRSKTDSNKIYFRVRDGLAEDKNDNWLNYQKSKRAFSGLKALRAIITDHGSDELKSRWISTFDDDDAEANSYVFTEGNGLVRDGNLFEIDLMSGKGNKHVASVSSMDIYNV